MPITSAQLSAYADILVRVGLNLQRGQRLLIAEPYEIQGVTRQADALVAAVTESARRAGAGDIAVIWGDETQYRHFAERGNLARFEQLVADRTGQLAAAVAQGDALLFLQASHPALLRGLPAENIATLRNTAWAHFGSVAQKLTRGATNWTAAPAPTPDWADAVYADLPPAERLPALWKAVAEACRATEADPIAAWQEHLRGLRRRGDDLDARRLSSLHFKGDGTDLTIALPPNHVWCTACLTTPSGLEFVANLPTEEVFTLPHRDSAEGIVRVARPVAYGGGVIDGVRLAFRGGQVVDASAHTGLELLQELLLTDAGAARLGEVALVPSRTNIARTGRLFFHPLLDENAASHIALGEAYAMTLREGSRLTPRQFASAGGNQSLIHLDLPIEASPIDDGASSGQPR